MNTAIKKLAKVFEVSAGVLVLLFLLVAFAFGVDWSVQAYYFDLSVAMGLAVFLDGAGLLLVVCLGVGFYLVFLPFQACIDKWRADRKLEAS
jgi:TRAP-type C4-dicarboxylate transport system permease small subunit